MTISIQTSTGATETARRKTPARVAPILLAGTFSLLACSAFAAGCGKGHDPGRYTLEIQSGGQARQIVYFVPSSYDGAKKLPAVFDFHGSTSTGNEQLSRSEWERVAEREGLIAIAPQGLMPGAKPDTFSWNVPGVTKPGGPNDMAFIKDAIAAMKETVCLDEQKLYGTGYSGGGRLLSQFICNGNTDFAAAGFVVGLRAGYPRQEGDRWVPDTESCKPAKPLSFIAFAGREDKINPYDGGGQPYWQYGAEAALQRWVNLDGCTENPESVTDKTVTVRRWTCAGKARIAAYVISDAGHTWPASTALLQYQQVLGKISYAVNATDEMWSFFKQATP